MTRLLNSLAAQKVQDFEVVILDQNADDALVSNAIQGTWPFVVNHVQRPDIRGSSRGRNVAVEHARGGVFVFPDDDCWYPTDFLCKALDILLAERVAFCTGRAADETGRTINGRFEEERQPVNRSNVWTTSIEWMLAVRADALRAVGGFDEDVGVGASTPWQAGEGQDLLLRLMRAGFAGIYEPDLVGHHEELVLEGCDYKMRSKMRSYARGMGFVLRKHGYSSFSVSRWLFRSLGGVAISVAQLRFGRARLYASVFLGRLEGVVHLTLGR